MFLSFEAQNASKSKIADSVVVASLKQIPRYIRVNCSPSNQEKTLISALIYYTTIIDLYNINRQQMYTTIRIQKRKNVRDVFPSSHNISIKGAFR